MLTCLRCSNSWYRRTPNGPKRCPACKSLKWRSSTDPITQARVRELLDYHEDGYLTWKVKYHPSIEIGDRAGTITPSGASGGYYRIGIDGKSYKLHRIIWLWHEGYLPEIVDHEDRNTLNCKISNLREVSKQCNSRNSKVRNDSSTGITGIFKYKNKNAWIAFISDNKKRRHLGVFKSLDDAVFARYKAEIDINWKGCNSTSPAYLYLKNKDMLP